MSLTSRPLLALLAILLCAAQPAPLAQPPSAPCSMVALNKAYLGLLQTKRSERSHHPQLVTFDAGLYAEALKHTNYMEAQDTLVHSHYTTCELIGALWDVERYKGDPNLIAAHIFQLMDESKAGHSEIQINPVYRYVSISCANKYYVVRLWSAPYTPPGEVAVK